MILLLLAGETLSVQMDRFVAMHVSRMNVSPGAHSIRHQNSSAVLGVSVYGFSSDNPYGYPGGMRLSPIQCIDLWSKLYLFE